MRAGSTAYSRIRRRLREDLLSGEFEPGARLTVAALAQRYGGGVMPIRAALQELHGQGLITYEPRRGARVRAVDEELLSNIYDLRIAILGMLYPRCARYITNADIEELEAVQDRLDAATARGDMTEVRRHNILFHSTIARIARNPEAAAVIERNWVLIDSLRARYGFGDGRMEDANRIHRATIEALRRRDGATAFACARTSAERSRQDLTELVRRAARAKGDAGSAQAAD